MSQRQDRINRIVAVEREYLAASVAADVLQERLGADPAFLAAHKLRSRDAGNLRSHLEGTCVIRLCAEFEAGLRDVWQNAFGRPTQPPLRDLLAAVGARRLVPQDALDRTDDVREYRNALGCRPAVFVGGCGLFSIHVFGRLTRVVASRLCSGRES